MGCIMPQCETHRKSSEDMNKTDVVMEREAFPKEIAEIRMRVKHVHFATEANLHIIPYKYQKEKIYMKKIRQQNNSVNAYKNSRTSRVNYPSSSDSEYSNSSSQSSSDHSDTS